VNVPEIDFAFAARVLMTKQTFLVSSGAYSYTQ